MTEAPHMKKIAKWIKKAGWLRLIEKLLPHAIIVISGMLVVFFVIDRVNDHAGFMTNEFHKHITFVLALLSICLAIRAIAQLRRSERREYKRCLRAAREELAAEPAPRKTGGRKKA